LRAVAGVMQKRHGQVRDEAGRVQSLVVFGLGKLGGSELNFSSDVDLIYAFAEHGSSDGARALDAEDYFTRIGQRLAQLLGDVTGDGFCHRVDLRLRPFGASGRVALSFAAMEQYYQREGRDWERYAWIKARPVAGDVDAGERLAEILRPFVYRRYLDYTALDGLREMKAMIDAEVEKREMADNLKLGPGGIREIEFLVQAMQLIRAGREPELRQRSLLRALEAVGAAGHLPARTVRQLAEAYRFLRRLENRVQMLGDQQTHVLPENPVSRERIARSLDYSDSAALMKQLDHHRRDVTKAFAGLLQARRRKLEASAITRYWNALPDKGDAEVLADAGFADAKELHLRLRDFARSPSVAALTKRGRYRLDHVLPALIEASAHSSAPDAALPRGLALIHAIARRSSYLALLDEQPAALARLVDVTARSALLSERLASHPLLLDELLDSRAAGALPGPEVIRAATADQVVLQQALDMESGLVALNELRQSLSFRIALATLAQRQAALASARQLAELADGLLRAVLDLVRRDIEASHGTIPGVGFAVIAYGSVGGRELGFDSDLDLVFLHDAKGDETSDGERPLEVSRYFARLAQKLVSLLGTLTSAGKLYEVDVRLRPDGAKGVLVSSVQSFSLYQQSRAWTWEQQALVRARAVAGDAAVCEQFEQVRRDVITRERDLDTLKADVISMRRRMRDELDRSRGASFDLKQGEGGLVDLEFLLQEQVLALAAAHPSLCLNTDTPTLLMDLSALGSFPEQAQALLAAHGTLLARGLDCTLDRRPRITLEDEAIAHARAVVRAACRDHGLVFSED
jgi:glutamate-ammonia-ligase adenylyltransferase